MNKNKAFDREFELRGFRDILRHSPISPRFAAKDNTMKKIKPEEFFKFVDKKWKYITMDWDGLMIVWQERPVPLLRAKGYWKKDYAEYFLLDQKKMGVIIDWQSDYWNECIAERR